MNENSQNFASVTNPAEYANAINEYALVYFGDSIAYVPRKSKFYASIMRGLISAAIECPGDPMARYATNIVFQFENVFISDYEMLDLVATRYERPLLPTQAAFLYQHGKTAEEYADKIAKFRARRRKSQADDSQTPENQAT